MLEIKIVTKSRWITRYAAVGHSNNTCGSVTCLARTFIRLASNLIGVQVPVDAPQEGSLFFEVFTPEKPLPESIAGLTRYSEFVLQAIADLSEEFKDEVILTVTAET